jgi:uncharacterized membrane protein YhaH (DUF805 family)
MRILAGALAILAGLAWLVPAALIAFSRWRDRR